MDNNIKLCVLIYNIVLPLGIGFGCYYLFFPEAAFVKIIDSCLGGGLHLAIPYADFIVIRLIRNYLMDFLWSYALTFSLFWMMDNNAAAKLRLCLWIAFGFSAFLEVLQCTSFVPGTFDVFDIFVEFLGIRSAAFIIRRTEK